VRHAGVLRGAEDGKGLAVEDGELGLLVGGDEEPGSARGSRAGVAVAEAVEEVEPLVSDEEARPGEEERARGGVEALLDFREGEADEGTEVRPVGGTGRGGVGFEDDGPVGARLSAASFISRRSSASRLRGVAPKRSPSALSMRGRCRGVAMRTR
jgi:hypothetical protein